MGEGGGVLIERAWELAELWAGLERAKAGNGGAITIHGPAGIGKSSLLGAAMKAARELGLTVLSAQGSELEQDFPFGVARQLLEAVIVGASRAERDRLLSGAARLGAPALGVESGGDVQPEPSFGLLHGLYWLVANLCLDGPLLLVVDDAQLADIATLRFLIYLVRRIDDLPLLALFARRTGDPETDRRLLDLLAVAPEVPVITPKPLSPDGAAKLLEAELGEAPKPELARRCHTQTGGNPFLLRELARGLASDGAVAGDGELGVGVVSHAILVRLGRLGADVVALAKAVAILGDGCAVADAARLAALEVAAAGTAASMMMRAEILAPTNELRFVHPLVRDAIEGEMTTAERGMLHGQAARMLIDAGAEGERVISQLLSSVPTGDADVAARLTAAGLDALAKGAPLAAIRHLRRALEEPPSRSEVGDVLTALGTAELLTDQAAEAVVNLRRARELSDDQATLVDRTLKLWLALLTVGEINQGADLIDATIEQVCDQDREGALMLESERFTAALFDPSRLAESWKRLEPFRDLPGETPAERRLLSMVTVNSLYTAGDPAPELADIARRAYCGGELVSENPLDPTKWVWAVGCLVIADQIEQSEAALELALDSARSTGSLETLLMVLDLRSLLRLRQGRLADALADAEMGLERLSDVASTPVRDLLTLVMVRWELPALIDQGRLEEADALVRRYQLDGELVAASQHTKLYRERAMLRLSQGRVKDALRDATTLGEFDAQYAITDVVEAPWRPVAALAYARLGDIEQAVGVAEKHLALARAWGLPRDLCIALRVRGVVEPQRERQLQFLREAVSAVDPLPAPLEAAKSEAELGVALVRMGNRNEGKELLMLALDGATRCGATALARRVHEELRVAGARPRRLMFSGVEGLTASERRVAEMAAEGMTNREIAQALFVTLKTVESHLGKAFRKLDVSSRTELAEALARAPKRREQSMPEAAA